MLQQDLRTVLVSLACFSDENASVLVRKLLGLHQQQTYFSKIICSRSRRVANHISVSSQHYKRIPYQTGSSDGVKDERWDGVSCCSMKERRSEGCCGWNTTLRCVPPKELRCHLEMSLEFHLFLGLWLRCILWLHPYGYKDMCLVESWEWVLWHGTF